MSVHVEHVANRPSYTEQSDTRQTGRYIKHARPTSKHARETAKLKLNGVNQICQSIYLSIRRHLLHRKLHGHADKSNRLKISEAPAEWMRVADYPWQSWHWMAYAMYIKHARATCSTGPQNHWPPCFLRARQPPPWLCTGMVSYSKFSVIILLSCQNMDSF